MMRLLSISDKSAYWNEAALQEKGLLNLLELIVQVIPVHSIYYAGYNSAYSKLIIVKDRYRYQESKESENLLNFISASGLKLCLFCYDYCTVFDYLKKEQPFFSLLCNKESCLYSVDFKLDLPYCKTERLDIIWANALSLLRVGLEKAFDFFEGALFYSNGNKLTLAIFMLHQCCERLFKSLILVFSQKLIKSHDLICLCEEARFLSPFPISLFDFRERHELKWLALVQEAYIDARYNDNYSVLKEEFDHLHLCVYQFLLKMNSGYLIKKNAYD